MTRFCTTILVAAAILAATGCLRQRWHAADESFRDHPAIPRQNFGRTAEQRGQAGLDDRSRAIESSLGVEGEPARLFNR